MSMTRVREPHSGQLVTCAWDDCERPGWQEVRIEVTDPGADRAVTYVFCTDRHRDYWRHSHKDNGNLPPGSKLRVL